MCECFGNLTQYSAISMNIILIFADIDQPYPTLR